MAYDPGLGYDPGEALSWHVPVRQSDGAIVFIPQDVYTTARSTYQAAVEEYGSDYAQAAAKTPEWASGAPVILPKTREEQAQMVRQLGGSYPESEPSEPAAVANQPQQDLVTVGDTAMTIEEQILAAAGGNNYYTFDQWNWFYESVTGIPGPAPESVGLSRDANGSVYVNGIEYIDFPTWKTVALKGQIPGREPTQDGSKTLAPPVVEDLLSRILELIKKLAAALVGGKWQ